MYFFMQDHQRSNYLTTTVPEPAIETVGRPPTAVVIPPATAAAKRQHTLWQSSDEVYLYLHGFAGPGFLQYETKYVPHHNL
jgi:hypothetical protein